MELCNIGDGWLRIYRKDGKVYGGFNVDPTAEYKDGKWIIADSTQVSCDTKCLSAAQYLLLVAAAGQRFSLPTEGRSSCYGSVPYSIDGAGMWMNFDDLKFEDLYKDSWDADLDAYNSLEAAAAFIDKQPTLEEDSKGECNPLYWLSSYVKNILKLNTYHVRCATSGDEHYAVGGEDYTLGYEITNIDEVTEANAEEPVAPEYKKLPAAVLTTSDMKGAVYVVDGYSYACQISIRWNSGEYCEMESGNIGYRFDEVYSDELSKDYETERKRTDSPEITIGSLPNVPGKASAVIYWVGTCKRHLGESRSFAYKVASKEFQTSCEKNKYVVSIDESYAELAVAVLKKMEMKPEPKKATLEPRPTWWYCESTTPYLGRKYLNAYVDSNWESNHEAISVFSHGFIAYVHVTSSIDSRLSCGQQLSLDA